jgi:tetratricopeptide (TPR) repeat protein
MEAMRGDAGEALRALTRYRALVPAEDLVQKVDTDADFEPLRADEGFRRGVAALMGVAPRPAPPVGLPQGDEGDDEEELVSAGGGASDPRVLGEAALRRGAYDEAQPLLREAALGAPRDASLWFLLAQSEGGRGNVAGALFALKKYRGLKPHEDLIYKVGEDDAFGPVWRDGRFQRELGAMMAP